MKWHLAISNEINYCVCVYILTDGKVYTQHTTISTSALTLTITHSHGDTRGPYSMHIIYICKYIYFIIVNIEYYDMILR